MTGLLLFKPILATTTDFKVEILLVNYVGVRRERYHHSVIHRVGLCVCYSYGCLHIGDTL